MLFLSDESKKKGNLFLENHSNTVRHYMFTPTVTIAMIQGHRLALLDHLGNSLDLPIEVSLTVC